MPTSMGNANQNLLSLIRTTKQLTLVEPHKQKHTYNLSQIQICYNPITSNSHQFIHLRHYFSYGRTTLCQGPYWDQSHQTVSSNAYIHNGSSVIHYSLLSHTGLSCVLRNYFTSLFLYFSTWDSKPWNFKKLLTLSLQ
jgi:hypothetical protein